MELRIKLQLLGLSLLLFNSCNSNIDKETYDISANFNNKTLELTVYGNKTICKSHDTGLLFDNYIADILLYSNGGLRVYDSIFNKLNKNKNFYLNDVKNYECFKSELDKSEVIYDPENLLIESLYLVHKLTGSKLNNVNFINDSIKKMNFIQTLKNELLTDSDALKSDSNFYYTLRKKNKDFIDLVSQSGDDKKYFIIYSGNGYKYYDFFFEYKIENRKVLYIKILNPSILGFYEKQIRKFRNF